MYKLTVANLCGTLGSAILTFIVGLMILKQTDSVLYFGVSQAIGPICAVLLLPFTGSVADKYNKKHIIMISQSLSILALIVMSLTISTVSDINLYILYAVLIVLKISDQFLSTTFLSATKQLVIEEHVHKLKSIEQTISALSQLLAPIVGVVLFAMLPLQYVILIEVVMEASVIAVVWLLNFKLVKADDAEQTDDLMTMFKEGVNFIVTKHKFRSVLLMIMLINCLVPCAIIGLPYIQIHLLHFSDQYYSVSEFVFAFGIIASGIWLSTKQNIKYPLSYSWQFIALFGGLIALIGGVLWLPLATQQFFYVIAGLNFLLGVVSTCINIPLMTWVTKSVPASYQGRIFNIIFTSSQLLSPIGMVIFSFLFDRYHATVIFGITGLLFVLATIIWPVLFKIELKDNRLN